MAERIAQSVADLLQNYLSRELVVFIISMLPILELRGGMIIAKAFGMAWGPSILISIIGNVIPIPFILLFIKQFLQFLKRFRPFQGLVRWVENKAYRKGGEIMEKYPKQVKLALFLFVAIPLPGTGAWTGSLVASFLGLKIKDSWWPICLGVLGASVIMSVLAFWFPSLLGF